MKGFILCLVLPVVLLAFISPVAAASFSIDRGTVGTADPDTGEISAIELLRGTGARPNTVYNSDLSGTNTVGAHGWESGAASCVWYEDSPFGMNVDAIHFGPGIDPELIDAAYFSLDYGAGYSFAEGASMFGLYPPGSGTEAAQGTQTMPANVYMSEGNGTNVNPYPFPGPDLGMVVGGEPAWIWDWQEEDLFLSEDIRGSNLDAFDLQDFTSPDSYPLYFSLDIMGGPWNIDFDWDGNPDLFNVSGADILVSEGKLDQEGFGIFEVAVPAEDLGLEDYANIDALTMFSDGSWLFSVDHGWYYDPFLDEWIETLGPQGFDGTAVFDAGGTGRRPANIYQSFADETNTLWLSSADLGLPSGQDVLEAYDAFDGDWRGGPNLDAFDLSQTHEPYVIPEPSTLLLLGLSLLGARLLKRKS